MRLARPALVAAVGASFFFASSASAAKTLTWTDQASDANGINSQYNDIAALDKGTPTPVSDAGRDILKVSIAKLTKKVGKRTVCDGFTATMSLSGPPVANSIYRVNATTAESPSTYYLEYDTATGSTAVRWASSTTDDDTAATKFPARVKGNTITWRFPMSDVLATDEKAGSVLKTLSGTAAGSVAGLLYLPLYDVASAPASATYTICS